MKSSLIIISGSAGAGKDSVLRAVKNKLGDLYWAKTTTDRPPRKGEREGNPYYFISSFKFKELIKQGAFLEYENVYQNNYFGMTKKEIYFALKEKSKIIWQIDFRGFRKIKKLYPKQITSIFILPPSIKIAEMRIRKRGGEEDEELIRERIKLAKKEIKASKEYDYRIVNEENKLNKTVDRVISILKKVS